MRQTTLKSAIECLMSTEKPQQTLLTGGWAPRASENGFSAMAVEARPCWEGAWNAEADAAKAKRAATTFMTCNKCEGSGIGWGLGIRLQLQEFPITDGSLYPRHQKQRRRLLLNSLGGMGPISVIRTNQNLLYIMMCPIGKISNVIQIYGMRPDICRVWLVGLFVVQLCVDPCGKFGRRRFACGSICQFVFSLQERTHLC